MSPRVDLAPQEWFTLAELAALGLPGLATTKRGVQLNADREGWATMRTASGEALSRPRKARGGGVEYHLSLLSEAAQAKLAMARPAKALEAAPVQSRESVWRRYESLPSSLKTTAKRRLEIVQRVEELSRHGLNKTKAVEAIVTGLRREARAAGAEADVSESSVYAWFRAIRSVAPADRIAYLAPNYMGRSAGAECSPEAWQFYRDYYLSLSRPTPAATYRKTTEAGEPRGWVIPSDKTLARWMETRVSRAIRILMREGEDALRREMPWIDRDETTFHAMEAVNVDGHKWDVLADWGDGGKPERPMMIMIQDIFSRRVLGWRLCRSENANSVRMVFAHVFHTYGIPRLCFFDNGRAFASKWLTGGTPNRYRFKVREDDQVGLLTQMGVEVHFTTPYSGQSKPIERAFRDLEENIATQPAFRGAYVGNNPRYKPADAGTHAVPIDEFERIVADGILRHNARLKRDTRACARRLSFDQAFEASYAKALVTMPTAEQLRQAMLCVEGVTVRQNGEGVVLAGNRYWADFLIEHVGEKIAARFDADDLHAGLHLYTLPGVYLGFARCQDPVGFANAEEGRERKRLQRKLAKSVKEAARLERQLSDAELADLIPAAEEPEPVERGQVVRGLFSGSAALKLGIEADEVDDLAAFNASANRRVHQLFAVGDDD